MSKSQYSVPCGRKQKPVHEGKLINPLLFHTW